MQPGLDKGNKKTGQSEQRDENEGGFARQLGLASAFSIGLGTMLGAGLFVLAPEAAQEAGPGAAITYLLAGLIVLPTAMVVSELATAMPQEGGSYHLISRTLGPLAAAVVGPANWLGLAFATSFYLIGFTRFFTAFWDLPEWIIILVVGAAFVYINYRGAQATGIAQNFIVAAVVIVLVIFIARGVFAVEGELHRPFIPAGWGSVLSGVGLVIVSFTGFEKVSSIAEEIKKPGRNLPMAIIGSVIIATLLYGGVVFVMTGVVSLEQIERSERPLVLAGENVWGGFGTVMMLFGGLLATASSANAAIMASSRINFAMGRDRILPEWFGKLHEHTRTPYRSIFLTGGMAVLLALTGAAEILAEIGSALFMISYALMAAGVLLMRSRPPEWYRPAFRVPLYPWIPVIGGIAALAVIITMDPLSQIAGLGLAGASILWYFVWARRHNRVESQLQEILTGTSLLDRLKNIPAWLISEREEAPAGQPSASETRREILIGAEDVSITRQIIKVATLIAKGRQDTHLRIVKVQTVPQTVAKKYADAHYTEADIDPEGILHQLREQSPHDGVPLRTETQLARSVSGGILQAARENEQVDLILLGLGGELKPDAFSARIDKEVGSESDIPVGVLVGRELQDFRRILVAGGEHDHARLALQVARDLQLGARAKLVVLYANQEQKPKTNQQFQAVMNETIGVEPEGVDLRVVKSNSLADAILQEARQGYDLVIVGSPGNWSLTEWVFGKLSDTIARKASIPVLIVHQGQGEARQEQDRP